MNDLRPNDEEKRKDRRRRVDWFARALGEDWKTEGDGIYRHVPEPSSIKAPELPSTYGSFDELNDALAPGARLEHEVEPRSAGDDQEPSTERRGPLWRRR